MHYLGTISDPDQDIPDGKEAIEIICESDGTVLRLTPRYALDGELFEGDFYLNDGDIELLRMVLRAHQALGDVARTRRTLDAQ